MDANTIVVAVISVTAYFIVLIGFYSKPITQQLFFLFIYLVGLTVVSHMTVLLPIYFLFSLFPIVIKTRRVSKITLFLLFYFGTYLILGILGQDAVATITAFVGKFWQFLIFFIVLDSQISEENGSLKQIVVAVIIECGLGIYLLQNGRINLATETVRLVSGAQPISGNIAIVVLPLTVYLYFWFRNKPQIETRIIGLNFIFLLWIIRSGTRGYLLMYAFTMFWIFYDYFFRQKKRNYVLKINRLLLFFSSCIVLLLFIIFIPEYLEKVMELARISGSVTESLGIRIYENAAEWEFFINAPWFIKIFGIGLGGTAGEYPDYVNAIMTQLSLGMWQSQHYLYESGVMFHNLYANTLLTLGVTGIIVIVIINIAIWKRISRYCCGNNVFCRIFHLYQIGFFIMNYYRWSGDCGISEMIILALVLKLIKKRNFEFENQFGRYK